MGDFSLSRAAPVRFRMGRSAALLLMGCLPVLAVPALLAQTAPGIDGIVTDQQGLPIPDAEIVVSNPATAIEAKLTTDSNGSFRVVGLPAGTYNLKASRVGHSTPA